MASLGTTIVKRRRVVLAVVALFTIVALAGVTRLRVDFTVDDLFADAGDLRRVTKEARSRFGNTDNALLVVFEYGAATAGDWSRRLSALAGLTASIQKIDGVERARSVATLTLSGETGLLMPPRAALNESEAEERIRAALATPLVRGRLLAADGSVAVVLVALKRDVLDAQAIGAVVADVHDVVRALPLQDGERISLGGLPFVRVEVVRAMNRDQARLLPIGFAICLLVLVASFRWWPAVVFPLLAIGLSALFCIGGLAWSGTPLGVVTNIVPLLIVIIGVSDSIHLIARLLEERSRGSVGQAAAVATDRVLMACLLTSVTTAIGFASLAGSDFSVLRTFGIVAASGVLIAFAVTISFLPAALAMTSLSREGTRGLAHSLSLAPLTRRVLAHRWPVLAVFAILSAGAAVSLRYLEVDEGVRRQFDADTEAGRTMSVMEQHLEGIRPVDLLLSSKQRGRFREPALVAALDTISRWASRQPDALASRSVADVLREIRFAVSGTPREAPIASDDNIAALATLGNAAGNAPDLITADFSHARIAIALADVGSKSTLAFAARLQEFAADTLAPFEDVTFVIGGEGYASSLGLEFLIRDLAQSLAIALFGILVVLAIALRSVRLAVIGMIPSALPIAFGLAYMTLRGIPLGTATVIVFSVALGLAVDGTIHVLARYREEREGGTDEALICAVDASGRAIIATSLTLVVGFGVLAASSFVPVRHFGELIAVSIGASLVCQLVMLPPLLSVAAGDRRRASPTGL